MNLFLIAFMGFLTQAVTDFSKYEHCYSWGDPHLTPFDGGNFDMYIPNQSYVMFQYGGLKVSYHHDSHPSRPRIYRVWVEIDNQKVLEYLCPNCASPTIQTSAVTKQDLTAVTSPDFWPTNLRGTMKQRFTFQGYDDIHMFITPHGIHHIDVGIQMPSYLDSRSGTSGASACTFQFVKDGYIGGHQQSGWYWGDLGDKTLKECQDLCASTANCKAIDYQESNKRCNLRNCNSQDCEPANWGVGATSGGFKIYECTTDAWKLVARQTWPYIFNKNEWSKNPTDSSQANFAILDQLATFKQNGKFTFKLKYPNEGVEYEWSQTSNPVTATTGHGVLGYQPINVPADLPNCFGGLEYNNAQALLDGTVKSPCPVSNWYYAVGSIESWNSPPGIPAASQATQKVELYVKAEAATETYIIGASGSNSCPAGYQEITSVDDCKAARNFLQPKTAGMRDFATSFSGSSWQKGCFQYLGTSSNNHRVYFNTHAVGNGNSDGKPICKSATGGMAKLPISGLCVDPQHSPNPLNDQCKSLTTCCSKYRNNPLSFITYDNCLVDGYQGCCEENRGGDCCSDVNPLRCPTDFLCTADQTCDTTIGECIPKEPTCPKVRLVNPAGVKQTGNKIELSGHGTAWNKMSFDNTVVSTAAAAHGVRFKCPARKYLMVGLTSKDLTGSESHTSLDYAFYCSRDGTNYAYEKGSNKFHALNVMATDAWMEIRIVGDEVEYIQDGRVFYTSAAKVTGDLHLGVAWYENEYITDLQYNCEGCRDTIIAHEGGAVSAGWSNSKITDVGSEGLVHGPWGKDNKVLQKTFTVPANSKCKVEWTHWAVNTRDSETDRLLVNGVEKWSKTAHHSGCTNGWLKGGSDFPNSNAVHPACYLREEQTFDCSGATIIRFESGVDQIITDESWAVSDFRLSTICKGGYKVSWSTSGVNVLTEAQKAALLDKLQASVSAKVVVNFKQNTEIKVECAGCDVNTLRAELKSSLASALSIPQSAISVVQERRRRLTNEFEVHFEISTSDSDLAIQIDGSLKNSSFVDHDLQPVLARNPVLENSTVTEQTPAEPQTVIEIELPIEKTQKVEDLQKIDVSDIGVTGLTFKGADVPEDSMIGGGELPSVANTQIPGFSTIPPIVTGAPLTTSTQKQTTTTSTETSTASATSTPSTTSTSEVSTTSTSTKAPTATGIPGSIPGSGATNVSFILALMLIALFN